MFMNELSTRQYSGRLKRSSGSTGTRSYLPSEHISESIYTVYLPVNVFQKLSSSEPTCKLRTCLRQPRSQPGFGLYARGSRTVLVVFLLYS